MKHLITLLSGCLLAAMLSPIQSEASDLCNTKLLLHGTKTVADSSQFGVAGWFILPNPGSGTVVAVAGPRLTTKSGWVELMVGFKSVKQAGELLIDLRVSYDAYKPIHFWTNVEYFPTTGDWYLYVDCNYDLGSLGKIGLETENTFYVNGRNNLSIGPRIVVPFTGQFAIVGAYQFHSQGNQNQAWARAVVNF
ncbi:MAG: hypothetical protein WCT27_01760 [Patescibacteria group bacterium]